MNKIKILSLLIFILALVLAIYSKQLSQENDINLEILKTINEQKAFTQEISKNIFYIYNNRNASTNQLDESVNSFVENVNHKNEILKELDSQKITKQTKKILLLWNNFYLLVQKFRDLSKVHNAYSNIILEKLMSDIYKANVDLVVEFNKLIRIHKEYFDGVKKQDRAIQIILFLVLLVLLIYFFTQLKELLLFIQKFLDTSKNIIQKSTVKGIHPIEVTSTSEDVSHALNDFNFLIQKINKSIDYSENSIQNSIKSLEDIEVNIEDLIELIATMENDGALDKELINREDILIEALEELSTSAKKLEMLQINLKNFKEID
ncbi:hypothetical protein [Sulfurimonas sp.]|uniref:hypothetical protein n=1 Tax=Sulfurimonas sp. TaxID=2022749 RepID=UPI002629BC83|nr:hypothetical protein [Sulfurimonas sp.]